MRKTVLAPVDILLSVIISLMVFIWLPTAAYTETNVSSGRPISLDAKGAEAADVLRLIAKLGNCSLVVDNDIKGPVTVALKGVTVEQALDLITMSYGWTWKMVDKTIVVAGSQKVKDTIEPQETAIFSLKYASPADITSKLNLYVPVDRVRVDNRTNTVFVTGTRDELAKVKQMVEALDIPIPQVAIVARVEEISSSAMRKLGIDWDFGKLQIDTTVAPIGVSLGYESTLKILEDNGDAVSLAKPGITTLDGNEANILLGDKVPVPIETIEKEQVVKNVQFVEVGVKLKILPRVNKDGRVTVVLSPEISSLTGFTDQGYPQISTRQAQTIVNVRNGETIAIGGLFQRQEIDSLRKVPFLGDLPILGSLFRTKTKNFKDSEVVVFVTPIIIDPDKPDNVYTADRSGTSGRK
jgi:type II secretory pathway component GspD/PulD (secretin)